MDTKDDFIVLTRNDEDMDKILQEIKSKEFTLVLPLDLRARRMVLVFNVDDIIYRNTKKEIEKEFIDKNELINEGIDNIFKFRKINTLKICFTETATAKSHREGIAWI